MVTVEALKQNALCILDIYSEIQNNISGTTWIAMNVITYISEGNQYMKYPDKVFNLVHLKPDVDYLQRDMICSVILITQKQTKSSPLLIQYNLCCIFFAMRNMV